MCVMTDSLCLYEPTVYTFVFKTFMPEKHPTPGWPPMGPMGSGPLGPWEGLGAPGSLVVIVLLVLQFLDDFWRRRFDS